MTSPIHKDQIIITYEHEDDWKDYYPTSQADKLPGLMKLLSSNRPVKVAFFGDSITAGCDASGFDEIAIDVDTIKEKHIKNNFTQCLPSWAYLVT